ncbi:MAG: VWA domain-containing protein [Planctomycetota bacterium]
MNLFRFHDPLWFLLLLPATAAAVWAMRRRRSGTVLYSSVAFFRDLPPTMAQHLKPMLPWVRWAGLCLLILALARPQEGEEESRIQSQGIAIEMCLDRSGSMRGLDFQIDGRNVTRLEAVKQVFQDFVAGKDGLSGRPDDLIGLIAFGGFADNLCPLTLDHVALVEMTKKVEIAEPIINSRGEIINQAIFEEEQQTAIGDAVAAGVDRLKQTKAKSKVLILLSDGENTAGILTPEEAAEIAKAHGIKIYSIGVGTSGQVPVKVTDPFGRQRIQYQQMELDEATLKMLADKTGGQYFHAGDTEALKEVYAAIDELEKTEVDSQVYSHYRELFAFALVPGLFLVFMEVGLSATRFRTLP